MMRTVARVTAALAIAAALLPVHVAEGRIQNRQQLRLDGYVGPPPAGRRERADLRMQAGKQTVRFQVTNATVPSGQMKASAVFSKVRPLHPNFILRGPQALVDQVA